MDTAQSMVMVKWNAVQNTSSSLGDEEKVQGKRLNGKKYI